MSATFPEDCVANKFINCGKSKKLSFWEYNMSKNSHLSKLLNINLLNGLFTGEMDFKNGLNIISGENGTGKTKLLQQIKGPVKFPGSPKTKSAIKKFTGSNTDRIVIFNPKRNAEKQKLEHFANKLKREGLDSDKIIHTLNEKNINDATFLPYPSLGELFILSYEALTKKDDGSISNKDAIDKIKSNFNLVLEKVFPAYKILSEWKNGKLQFQVQKNGNNPFPVEGLSCGESEALSLMFNIYASRDIQDIYLIDEPEVHLNWSLEEGMFNFLEWFCNEYGKQIIVATHSRMIFQERFLQKTQFLIWKDGKINVDSKISKEISDKIAGDSIKIISALDLHEQTFFVEDDAHVKVIKELSKVTEKDLGAIKLGGSSAVCSFCRAAEAGNIQNAYFLVDGDNQGAPKDLKNNSNYIHLQKYCIQNYLLDTSILSEISKIDCSQIKQKIKKCITDLSCDSKTLVFKKLAEVTEIPDAVLDTFDASKIIDSLAIQIGLTNFRTLVEKFIAKAKEKGNLETIFGEILSKVD